MVIKRINAVSCAKIMGLLYAVIGFLGGSIVALVSLAGGMTANKPNSLNPFAFVGVGAVILFPLIYGAIGFVFTWLSVVIFNLLSRVVGGIKVEVGPLPGSDWNALEASRLPTV